jgi:alpha-tubulin suppressor-like RCC1 family protein
MSKSRSGDDDFVATSGISRRTIVQGTAWAAPVVLMSAATPAFAASGEPAPPLQTIAFTKSIYTAVPTAAFLGAETPAVTVYNGGVPVSGAMVTFTIQPPATVPGTDPIQPADAATAAVITFAGGAVSATVVTNAPGLATAPTATATGTLGSLAIQATLVSIPDGTATATPATAVMRVTGLSDAWAWGYGGYGELGTGTTASSKVPVGVALPPVVKGIKGLFTSTNRNAFVLDTDDRLWGWGSDSAFRLFGLGNTATPTDVSARFPRPVVQVAGGWWCSYALLDDGTVYFWGVNSYQLYATGKSSGYTDAPVKVPGLAGVTKIVGRQYGGYFLLADGTVWTYGFNSGGALGNNDAGGTTVNALIKITFPTSSPVVDIAGRDYGGLAAHADGTVSSWGSNDNGSAGVGTSVSSVPAPVLINVGGKAAKVYAAFNNCAVLLDDGRLMMWGRGTYNNLGNGKTTDALSPIPVSLPGSVVSVAVGDCTTHAILANGELWSWGWNAEGEVGDGTTTQAKFPVKTIGLTGTVVQVAATEATTYVLMGTS